ncbi:porin [Enterovibrio norvegicus FF-33]|uniref:porin n=1 Tax=Enterovibrio norvegicus TaxID=188144 RepID=UPI00030EE509|nr:porin [Enterovibrio norvegicus]OEE68215.1 porin [Enterovibrio norvegicus FF-33]
MEKMFKRSIVATAVTAAALASTVAMAKPATETVDLYGQVAVSMWQYGEHAIGGGDQPITFENESRFGLRGSADLERAPKFIWQLEGGNVGDAGAGSGLGVRDTFAGFEFEDGGKVRVGRMLTPLYQMIDWPYSGQRAGAVFDWGGDVLGGGRYDRQSNMIRYDSAKMGGLNFSVAAGRGTESDDGSNFYGLSASYNVGIVTFHAGYEAGSDRSNSSLDSFYNSYLNQVPGNKPSFDKIKTIEGSTTSDTNAALIGFEAYFDNGFGVYAAYKMEAADYDDATITLNEDVKDSTNKKEIALKGASIDQDSISVGVVYGGVENWQFKANYAANFNADVDNDGSSFEATGTEDSIFSVQALYFLDPAAIVYARPYVISKNDSDHEFGYGLGLEYYF